MSLITSLVPSLDRSADDPAGALLGFLIEHRGEDLSVSDAARGSGVSKATAARTVNRLVEWGLVLDRRLPRERLISINTDSPMYSAVADLLWVARGADSSTPTSASGHYALQDSPPFLITDLRVRELIPVELQTRNWTDRGLAGEVYDGPDLPAARAVVPRLERARGRIPQQYWLQEAYAQWHDERDRDLIHLTTNLGQGVYQAVTVLRAGTRSPACAGRTAVGRLTWVHAVYAVDAEVRMCLQVSDFLTEAVGRGRRLKQVQRQVGVTREELQKVVADRAPDADAAVSLRDTLAEEETDLAEATQAMDGYYRHGGTPPVDSVDCAGERVMVVLLREVAIALSTLTHEMATHSSFQQWQQHNPQVAESRPLLPALSR